MGVAYHRAVVAVFYITFSFGYYNLKIKWTSVLNHSFLHIKVKIIAVQKCTGPEGSGG
jgi:hypothetical protein